MRNLLFDLDGTLADPLEGFSNSLFHAFDKLGLERPSLETVKRCIGPPLHVSVPQVLGIEEPEAITRLIAAYRDHHGTTGLFQYRFYDGVDGALEALTRDRRLFVATSKPVQYARPILERFGKARYFEEIYGSELSGERSLKGELISHALRASALGAGETIMIGDRKHDIIGAKANGLRAIGVTWGYGSEEELVGAGADWICRSWSELLAVFTA
ncbi:MAG: HAD hydrolase-like protein [Oligoflexia bacterium]|nr:HAD hydrolase-like protein [Oligoflexia bacterium]